MTGARYQIAVDGQRRSNRDNKAIAIEAAEYLAPPPGPSGGVSATLDEAMAAFRAKWDEQG
jgi:hypothetical protein